MIGEIISHYKILEKIGEGGMGKVYKAEDMKLRRYVAMKFLLSKPMKDDEEMQRFTQEARSAAQLDHPNICTVYEIGESDGRPFIVMAYIDGPTLKQKVGDGPLPIEEVIDIGIQIAKGLGEAHDAGIVHRDIKSANIMLNSRGQAKVMDFGVAKVLEGPRLTKVGSTIGTASYMSPEQVRGEEVDHRSDIWAFGILLYLMLTGKLPFEGSWYVIMKEILEEHPAPPSELNGLIPKEMETIINRCLQKDRENRYQNMEGVIADLARTWKHVSGDSDSGSTPVYHTMEFERFAQSGSAGNSAAATVIQGPAAKRDRQVKSDVTASKSKTPILAGVAALAVLLGAWIFWPSEDAANLNPANLQTETTRLVEDRPDEAGITEIPANKPLATEGGLDYKLLAERAEEKLLTSERQARGNDASKLAASTYNSAVQLKEQGQASFQKGDFEEAERLFSESTTQFIKALGQADVRRTQLAAAKKPDPAPKKTVIPTTDPNLAAADRSKNAMRQAKTKAANAGADDSSIFVAAENKEREAQAYYLNEKYDEANTAYRAAEKLYTDAVVEIANSSSKSEALRNQSQDAFQAAASAKAQLDDSYNNLTSYQQAVAAEQKGEVSRIGGDFASSISHYNSAKQLYQQAIKERELQITQIQTLIKNYALALESRSLDRLAALQTSQFSTQNDERWMTLFKVAKDLKVSTNTKEINFQPSGATAWVDVKLDFSGARGGGEWNTWKMELIERNGSWLVSNH